MKLILISIITLVIGQNAWGKDQCSKDQQLVEFGSICLVSSLESLVDVFVKDQENKIGDLEEVLVIGEDNSELEENKFNSKSKIALQKLNELDYSIEKIKSNDRDISLSEIISLQLKSQKELSVKNPKNLDILLSIKILESSDKLASLKEVVKIQKNKIQEITYVEKSFYDEKVNLIKQGLIDDILPGDSIGPRVPSERIVEALELASNEKTEILKWYVDVDNGLCTSLIKCEIASDTETFESLVRSSNGLEVGNQEELRYLGRSIEIKR